MDEPYLTIREIFYPNGPPAFRWGLIGRSSTGETVIAESSRTFSTEPAARLHFKQTCALMARMNALEVAARGL